MCGINGIISLKEQKTYRDKIAAMNIALSHRGPDNSDIYTNKFISFGHTRLSIIDLSNIGNQPFSTKDNRYTIVYNGEVYNFNEIKHELTEYNFISNTDTEVILYAYIKWGKGCLEKFNGMFAFAIWDSQNESVFIARDRIGIKPFYYYQSNDHFIFSSEIRALLKSGFVNKTLNSKALSEYLSFQTVHAPDTLVDGVKMLSPGHFVHIKNRQIDIESYWRLSNFLAPAAAKKNYNEICSDVRQLLFDSVEKRLVSDVPFGAFLSGGIDSSAIVGIMTQVAKTKVNTFSIVFKEKEYSEATYSKLIAKKFNTDHHEIELSITDFVNDISIALDSIDHPSGDGINTYTVSRATKNAGITMALSGLGGDELFAGYDVFRRIYQLNKLTGLNKIPKFIRVKTGKLLCTLKPGISSNKIAELLSGKVIAIENAYPITRQVYLSNEIQKLLPHSIIPTIYKSIPNNFFQKKISDYVLSRISVLEMSTYMQNVLLRDTDQMSMAHALEVRVPFLDHDLIEYVIGIQDINKYPDIPKKLLVDTLKNLLPDEIVYRKKMGFSFPWAMWLKQDLKSFCETAIKSIAKRDYFNKEEVESVWNKFLKGDSSIVWSKIWLLVVLEYWMQKNDIK